MFIESDNRIFIYDQWFFKDYLNEVEGIGEINLPEFCVFGKLSGFDRRVSLRLSVFIIQQDPKHSVEK